MANGSFLGQKTKITVVRKLKLDDVAREYGQIRPGTESGDFIPDGSPKPQSLVFQGVAVFS